MTEKYKGFEIHDARPTGGKAGRGRNKTTSIQIYGLLARVNVYAMVKVISYDRKAKDGRQIAIIKAKKIIDKLTFN